MRLPCLKRGRACSSVGNEERDDSIEQRKATLPVIFVTVEPDELATLPYAELEWASADQAARGRVLSGTVPSNTFLQIIGMLFDERDIMR